MKYTNEEVVNHLRLLAKGEVEDFPVTGLCRALIDDYQRSDLAGLLYSNILAWEHYSGNVSYFVPHPDYPKNVDKAREIYLSNNPRFSYGKTDDKYILLRRDLCNWFADLIEKL
jgi:hypothetical protein